MESTDEKTKEKLWLILRESVFCVSLFLHNFKCFIMYIWLSRCLFFSVFHCVMHVIFDVLCVFLPDSGGRPQSEFGRPSQIWVRPDSGGRPKSEFGQIRTAVPNLSSAGFGRPSPIWVRPDSDGRAGSAGFGRTGLRLVCTAHTFLYNTRLDKLF